MIMMRRSPWLIAVFAILLCLGAGLLIGSQLMPA